MGIAAFDHDLPLALLVGLSTAGLLALGPEPPAEQPVDAGPARSVAAPPAPAAEGGVPPLPDRLSETGLYLPGTRQIDPRNVEYSPQYPLWSDGAQKRRFVRVPDGAFIDASDPEAFRFPVGTRFWKEFAAGGRVETRFIERVADGSFRFASYVWAEDGSDATLAPERGLPGHTVRSGVPYDVPGRDDCRACHEGRSTPILGFTALQLSPDRDPNAPNAERPAPGSVDLRGFVERGLIRGLPEEHVRKPPRLAGSATTRAALGYLGSNCGMCHNAEGPLASVGLDLDAGFSKPDGVDRVLASAIDVEARFRMPGSESESLRIAPGKPAESALLFRMRSREASQQMPPLGTHRPDREAIALIERWITQDLERVTKRKKENR